MNFFTAALIVLGVLVGLNLFDLVFPAKGRGSTRMRSRRLPRERGGSTPSGCRTLVLLFGVIVLIGGGLILWNILRAGGFQLSLPQLPALSLSSFSQAQAQAAPLSARQQYIDLARQDAQSAGIDPDVFVKQITQESNFDPNALSPAGAQGIAQFMPQMAKSLSVNPWNPVEALQAAAHLMSRYVKQYQGDYAKALATYNAGPAAVQSALKQGGAGHWRNFLPRETRAYLLAIVGGG